MPTDQINNNSLFTKRAIENRRQENQATVTKTEKDIEPNNTAFPNSATENKPVNVIKKRHHNAIDPTVLISKKTKALEETGQTKHESTPLMNGISEDSLMNRISEDSFESANELRPTVTQVLRTTSAGSRIYYERQNKPNYDSMGRGIEPYIRDYKDHPKQLLQEGKEVLKTVSIDDNFTIFETTPYVKDIATYFMKALKDDKQVDQLLANARRIREQDIRRKGLHLWNNKVLYTAPCISFVCIKIQSSVIDSRFCLISVSSMGLYKNNHGLWDKILNIAKEHNDKVKRKEIIGNVNPLINETLFEVLDVPSSNLSDVLENGVNQFGKPSKSYNPDATCSEKSYFMELIKLFYRFGKDLSIEGTVNLSLSFDEKKRKRYLKISEGVFVNEKGVCNNCHANKSTYIALLLSARFNGDKSAINNPFPSPLRAFEMSLGWRMPSFLNSLCELRTGPLPSRDTNNVTYTSNTTTSSSSCSTEAQEGVDRFEEELIRLGL